jgi:hypothetical protein
MEYKRKSQAAAIADTYPSALTSEIEGKLHHLLNVLECMDHRTALDLDRLDQSGADEDLKDFVRRDIIARHKERRLPLEEAAEELRTQYRASIPGSAA